MKYYFICPDNNAPIGGIYQIYRQVDILNQYNNEATVVHNTRGFRCTWFDNDTKISYSDDIRPSKDDVIVVPEIGGLSISLMYPGIRKIVFNQNVHYTFNGYSIDPTDMRCPYLDDDVIGAVTVSNSNMECLEFYFPRLRVARVVNAVDPAGNLFQYKKEKEKSLAFIVTKNTKDVVSVINILKFHGKLKDWKIMPIHGVPLNKSAEIISKSAIYLSFGHKEGLSTPVVQALATGSAAVGYSGNMPMEAIGVLPHTRVVTPGDHMGFVKAIEDTMNRFVHDHDRYARDSKSVSAYVHDVHSVENEVRSSMAAWGGLTIWDNR